MALVRRRDAPDRAGCSSCERRPRGSWACDFFTVETIRLKTLYVLFFIHLSSRRVVLAGVTANPDSAWVTQQARNVAMDLNDQDLAARFLLRDHDANFTGCFDEVFCSAGAETLRIPIRAPKANAHAERWVQTVRSECLDWMLVLGRRHLLRILRAYVRHYNRERPHRGLALAVPRRGPRTKARCLSGSETSGVEMCSAVSSTSITGSQPDELGFPRPTGALPLLVRRSSSAL
jgi:transposase InsO family protein